MTAHRGNINTWGVCKENQLWIFQLPTGSLQCLFPFEVIYYSPLYSFHPRHIGCLVFLYHTRYIPPQDISTCCSSFWNSLPSTSAWLFPYLLQVCSNLIFKGLPSLITHSLLSSPPSLPYLSAYIGYYCHLTVCFFFAWYMCSFMRIKIPWGQRFGKPSF